MVQNENIRKAILDATLKLIAQHGFHKTPMKLIAEASGTTAGNIYHYFRNKEDLIHSLRYELKTDIIQSALKSDDPSLDNMRRLELVFLRFLDYFIDNPEKIDFLQQYESSPYAKNTTKLEHPDAKMLTNIAETAIREKKIRDWPFEIIYAYTCQVLIELSKLHNSGRVFLDEKMKKSTVEACMQAIRL